MNFGAGEGGFVGVLRDTLSWATYCSSAPPSPPSVKIEMECLFSQPFVEVPPTNSLGRECNRFHRKDS